jgi:hypothetical protein
MIVGLDFAFSFPAWFVRQQGCRTARALWAVCDIGARTGCVRPPVLGPSRARVSADATALGVFAKHVVHPERSEKNGVATHPFGSEEAPDEAPS